MVPPHGLGIRFFQNIKISFWVRDQWLRNWLSESTAYTVVFRAGSLNHFSHEPDRGEPRVEPDRFRSTRSGSPLK